ncbi:MAG: hypothetical protein IIC49_01820 [Planctomycetes bacterium]|nr:hypothetical protein [Planctomycetota bacterium]
MLTYTAGFAGIDDTGSLKIVTRYATDAGLPQFDDPHAPHYTTAVASNGARLRLRYDVKDNIRPWGRTIHVKVLQGFLRRGETITLTLGDRSGGSPGWRMQTFREETFELRVGVRTVFLPGENPETLPPVEELPINGEMAWAGIVAKNVFREPKPTEAVVVAPPTPETPVGKPSPPYHEWRMVGVWDGANTLGVILVNTRTKLSRLLVPGDRVLGAKLISAAGERAQFEVEGTRYELLQKQTLAEWRELH